MLPIVRPGGARSIRAPAISPVLAVFVVALFVRVGAQFVLGSYASPDTWEYDQMARSLLAGEGYHLLLYGGDWLTFGFPAFPLILAILHWLGGGPQAYGPVMFAMAIASSALVLLGHRIASLLYPRAALVTAILLAFDPVLILYAARVHELNLDALLLVALLVLALEHASGARRHPVPLGLAIGISAWARTTILAFGVIALAALASTGQRKRMLVAGAIALAVAAPWAVRNAILTGGVTAPNPYACMTLWMGNNPQATGGPLTADGRSVFDAMDDDLRARVIGHPEFEQGRAYCEEAAAFIWADPIRTIAWVAQKFAYFWWFPPHAGTYYPAGLLEAYRPLYAAQLLLAIGGVLIVWRRGWRAGLSLVLVELSIISIGQSLAYVEGRHRLVLEPTLVFLAAVPIALAARSVQMRRRRVLNGSVSGELK